MQMQGLQKALGTRQASLQSLKAGMDMLCIGNNLFDQEQEMAAIAQSIEQSVRDGTLAGSAIEHRSRGYGTGKALLAVYHMAHCSGIRRPSLRNSPVALRGH